MIFQWFWVPAPARAGGREYPGNTAATPRLREAVGGSARTRRDGLLWSRVEVEGTRWGQKRRARYRKLKKTLLAPASQRVTKKHYVDGDSQKVEFWTRERREKLLIQEFIRFWPINWRKWVASGPTSSRASHQDDGSMLHKLPQINNNLDNNVDGKGTKIFCRAGPKF